MNSVNCISNLYKHDESFADYFLQPQRFCERGWEYFVSPLDPGFRSFLDVIARIVIFVPLVFATICSYVIGVIGISMKAFASCFFASDREIEVLTPEIISDRWGTIVVQCDGEEQTFRDVAITPGKAEEWRWDWNQNEGSMHHNPGIRKIDLDHFILTSPSEIPDVVNLSQRRGHGGRNQDNPGPGALQVDPALEEYLIEQGVKEVHILKTAAAIEKYRECSADSLLKVAALIHTTC